MKHLIIFSFFVIGFTYCKKTNAPNPEPLPKATPPVDTTGTLDIDITNVVNGLPLLLSSSSYTNANNDTFKVDVLKYYFTNVILNTASGYVFTEVESYYLVNQANATSLHIQIKKVPRASYTSMQFLIGVDKDRNTSGAQTGALDPINDMFWTWNSGYIMAKLEGTSPQSGDVAKKIIFHLGGFNGLYNSVRNVQLNFPNTANVTETHTPTVHLEADIAKWFSGINTTDFSTDYFVMTPNSRSKAIADNYTYMFSVTSVVN